MPMIDIKKPGPQVGEKSQLRHRAGSLEENDRLTGDRHFERMM
jgi:hypothetical protein